MNNRIIVTALTLLSFVACTVVKDDGISTPSHYSDTFYARILDSETKVFADNKLRVLWDADDRVSIFDRYTFNQEYAFAGETGDNSGYFIKVPVEDYVTGNHLDLVYAVYPYRNSTRIDNDGVLTLVLTSEQSYREDSFGNGANAMASVTVDNQLLFRNLCGYLCLKLYGDEVSISSITLRGNDGEVLSGQATVSLSQEEEPVITMGENEGDHITICCDEPVKIGSTTETATAFWFVVPPVSFEKGFTITAYHGDAVIFEKTTTSSLEILRNRVTRMETIQVGEQGDVEPKKTISIAMHTNYPEKKESSVGIQYSFDELDRVIRIEEEHDGIKQVAKLVYEKEKVTISLVEGDWYEYGSLNDDGWVEELYGSEYSYGIDGHLMQVDEGFLQYEWNGNDLYRVSMESSNSFYDIFYSYPQYHFEPASYRNPIPNIEVATFIGWALEQLSGGYFGTRFAEGSLFGLAGVVSEHAMSYILEEPVTYGKELRRFTQIKKSGEEWKAMEWTPRYEYERPGYWRTNVIYNADEWPYGSGTFAIKATDCPVKTVMKNWEWTVNDDGVVTKGVMPIVHTVADITATLTVSLVYQNEWLYSSSFVISDWKYDHLVDRDYSFDLIISYD